MASIIWNRRAFYLLTVLVWLRGVAPGAVNYVSEYHLSSNVADAVGRAPQAANVAIVCSLALSVGSVLIVLFARPSEGSKFPSLVLLCAVPLYAAGAYAIGDRLTHNIAIDSLTLIVVLVAVFRLNPQLNFLSIIIYLATLTAGYSVIFALLAPSHAFFGYAHGVFYDADKAIVGSELLAGPFGHSNTLGIYLALSLPFALYVSNRIRRIAMMGFCFFVILWTGSRSAIIAALIGLAVTFVVSRTAISARRSVATLGLAAVGLTAAVLPFVVTDPRAFTTRGAIWQGSLQVWSRSPLFGGGPDWYSRIAEYANDLGAQASSGHNLVVTLLATGGIASLVLVAGVLFGSGSRAGTAFEQENSLVPFYYLVSFLTVSATEYVWVFDTRGELFLMVGFLLSCLLLSKASRAPVAPVMLHGKAEVTRSV